MDMSKPTETDTETDTEMEVQTALAEIAATGAQQVERMIRDLGAILARLPARELVCDGSAFEKPWGGTMVTDALTHLSALGLILPQLNRHAREHALRASKHWG